jgi:hypothetical protein
MGITGKTETELSNLGKANEEFSPKVKKAN